MGQPAGFDPTDNSPQGIDVSHLNGKINWPDVANSGIKFAFIKASQGANFEDPKFKENLLGAQAVGIKTYPYHYYNPGDDPQAQALNFLEMLGDYNPKIVAVDLEETGLNWMLAPRDTDGRIIQTFLEGISSTGAQIILYMTPSFKEKWLANADFLDGLRKWIAKWSQTPPSTDYTFWQFTSIGQVPGIEGDVDLDVFNGSDLP